MDYTTLIPSQHRKPKFSAWVDVLTQAVQDTIDFSEAAAGYYDLDTAIGHQLDVIGLWVGASRAVEVPLDNWFSFDIPGKGFDEGIWHTPDDPVSGLVNLDDVTYRRLLRAVILANHWDGTMWNFHKVINAAMPPGNTAHFKDNFNMTIDVHVLGTPLTPLMTALLTTGRLSLIKPAGVAIANYVLP